MRSSDLRIKMDRITVALITVFFGLLIGSPSNAGQSRSPLHCFKSKNSKKCSALQLTCPEGSEIYEPVVFGDLKCKTKHKCYGLTANLLVERNECYWKKSCVIQYPTHQFIKIMNRYSSVKKYQRQSNKCLYREPKCLKILGWKCVNSSAPRIYDSCNTNVILASGYNNGIVRSHDKYPWLYNNFTFGKNQSCNVVLHPHLDGFVVVTVAAADIDEDNDVGYITDGPQSFNITKIVGKTKRFRLGKNVTIHFSTKFDEGHFVSKGGSGFVVCFKFMRQSDYTSNVSACDGIITQNAVEPTLTQCPDSDEAPGKLTPCRKRKNTGKSGKRKKKKGKSSNHRKNKRDRKNQNKNKDSIKNKSKN